MNVASPRFTLSLAAALVLHAMVLLGTRTPAVVPSLAPAKLSLRFAVTPKGLTAPVMPVTPSPARPTVRPQLLQATRPVVPVPVADRPLDFASSSRAARSVVPKPTSEAAPQQITSVATPNDSAAAADTAGARVRYEQALAAWLDRHKYYPATLRRRRLEGEGVLRVELDREGKVVALESFAPLPDALLERVAMDWVRRADPFPPVPQEIAGASYRVRFPVRFRLD